ncbi:hypothetical protein W97_05687 [Coniosporium apollinis CBS 100218]|uniref:DUF2306 domain-containing protein n=1 Tax=Coniosporium apollinis (strain CBS 100218) TaxID=1168221 RepID=R7YWV8_CONA1|nr:uncharacterized protein W97_05687 [Coniosporium apollinis CBS 100218]EON66294.1 hypothetical protein W97_05687 [Coniosporium apollinis CBS 100218]
MLIFPVIIFAGAIMGFTLARLPYLNIAGTAKTSFANSTSPGEWYWYHAGVYRIGITLHLGTILPVGFLMVWQFVPVIRYKLLILHRINGYVIILLVLISNVGALMICRRSFGGTLDTQAGVGMLVILTTTSIGLAYYNIKRLQIDQHRAWMLRAMFYLGTIITMRLIMILSALIITRLGSYYTTRSCDEISFIYDSEDSVKEFYPQCSNPNSTVDGLVIVHASFAAGRPEQIAASLGVGFGMALWMALLMHLVGVEIYLALTPRESDRLRQVSYERQMERGFKNPGSAGLTSDRWGDAEPWRPMREVAAIETGE